MARITAAVIGVALVVTYAVGSGLLVQSASSWYLGLRRPSWQPPDVVFGIIWPYNFLVLGIAVVAVARSASATRVAMTLIALGLSIAAALAWSWLFYGPHRLGAATVALVIATACTVPVLVQVFAISSLLGWLLVPYQLWLTIATSLSWGITVLNR